MKKTIWFAVVLPVLFSACSLSGKNAQADTPKEEARIAVENDVVELSPAQMKNAGIVTGLPEEKELHSTLNVTGVVDVPPQHIVSVSMPLGGYLKRTALIPGARVSRGSVLATLEDPAYIQLQQEYLTAKSRLRYLEADLSRQKGLNETKVASDKTLQQVQSEYEGQRILLRSLAEKLRLIGLRPEGLTENSISRSVPLYAPISGYVSKVNVNIGKYVAPTDVLFELINPDDLHLELTVFENDAARLAPGQPVVFTANNRPEASYTARVQLVTPSIGEDRSTQVHCHLEQQGRQLLPGTFVNATIRLSGARVTAVPREAVVKWESKNYLFLQQGAAAFRMVPVETGTSEEGFTEIRSALPAGRIVTQNAYTLLMKMKNSGEEE
ncbi:efflux RND transporter periplasmic adaptor subunit [Paraflavisolibacter sp. H34]|uniref:efflux RND transporter periplasmic adaptor subunit n=1 Tax=Huijunlia imazamoxiresistens TaxID=3127457 RepID=UPI00301B1BCE